MSKILYYGFILSVILIIVVYAKGFRSTVEILGGSTNQLLKTITGRKEDGSFADYPTGM